MLISFRFLGPVLSGPLTMALVSAFGPPAAQVAVLGSLVSILGGLFLGYLEQEVERDRRRTEVLETLAVAWVWTAGYWQNRPGRQSLATNFAAHHGLLIEWVVILPAALWPAGAVLPADAIRPWV